MERRSLKQILVDQKEETERIFDRERIIERERQDHFKPLLRDKLIKVITGVRRSGKSIFSHLSLRGENYAYVNFDDERIVGIEAKDLNTLLEVLHEIYGDFDFILLDEIQNIAGWELFANRLMRQGYNLVITGSNSSLLSRELATHLTGRCVSFEMYPFSFREYLKYFDIKVRETPTTREIGILNHHLSKYINIGGFPEVYKVSSRTIYLRELYDMIISRDVVGRYKVKFVRDLKEMAFYLISNFSSRISYNKLKNIFRVKSVHTIKNYISYLEDAYMLFQLFPFSWKVKYQLMQVKKVYSIDTGLIEALSPGSSKNLGRIMENVVAVDILRREPRENVFFYLTPRHEEVDFVIGEGMKIKQLIQVTYASGRDEIEKREIKSLIKASNELKCKNLEIITWDYENEINLDGKTIKCIPLWKWLLHV
ncbi:MAG: hypothetical protein DRN19_04125 [Thermoplasmata archaeon]|nr:MAG: hypothetical protein DRN19_04125 [Thermoplasmata archaeon]